MATSAQQGFLLSPYWVDGLGTPSFDWEKYQDKIDILSGNLYDTLVSGDTLVLIESIVKKYSLSPTQGSDVARCVRDVILTDIYIGDMPAQISSKLGVDQNVAVEIARAIVSQLFAPVIDEIKKLQLQKFGKLPGSSTPQQPSAQRPVLGADLPETGGNIIDLRNQKL